MNSSETVLSYLVTRCSSPTIGGSKRRSRAIGHKSQGAVLLLLAVLLSGCGANKAPMSAGEYYYVNPDTHLTTVGRVAIVELRNDSSHPQVSSDITEALFRALQKKQIFGSTIVRRHDPSWRSLQLDQDVTYSLDQILALRETLKCDGVLTGTITEFRPYPHMAIGLRLKLLDLRDGQLLWALEQIWDTTDKKTEDRIKKYFKSKTRSSSAASQEWLTAVSPLEFIKFVSHEVAETL